MAQIEGSGGNDSLDGTTAADTLNGLGGDDRLVGLGGGDLLLGGEGRDTLDGGDGYDTLRGEDGDDSLIGGENDDALDGGSGRDTLIGGNGFNTLRGGAGDDDLSGALGSMFGEDGDDVLRPLYTAISGERLIDGGAGYDRVIPTTGLSPFTLINIEEIQLSTSNTVGATNQSYSFNEQQLASSVILVGIGAVGYLRVSGGGDFSHVTLTNFWGISNQGGSSVTGSAGNDFLQIGFAGSAAGGAGNDVFYSASVAFYQDTGNYSYSILYGREAFYGGEGDDVVYLPGGGTYYHENFYDVSKAPTLFDGGPGSDRLVITRNFLGDISDQMLTGVETLQLYNSVTLRAEQFQGFSEIDIRPVVTTSVWSSNVTQSLPHFTAVSSGSFDFSTKTLSGLSTIDFRAFSGNDTVVGDLGNDTLMGNAGSDVLAGRAGDDSLLGGAGDDTLTGGTGNDVLDGNEGNDRISLTGGGQDTVSGNAGFDTLVGPAGRLATTFTHSLEFTTIEGDSRLPSFSGTATTGNEVSTFTGIERFAFVDGQQIFDTGSTAFALARMYLTAFGRAPDGLGLTHNAAIVDGGVPLWSMAEAFAQSAEFAIRYPAISNAGFVTLMYQNTLGRAPDADGFAFWNRILDEGLGGRGSVLLGFSQSQEFTLRAQALLPEGVWLPDAHALAVARVYQATLGRHPDADGLGFWTGLLDQGLALRDIVPGFLGSDEFRMTYGALDDGQFLTALYQNVLGRAPDAPGYGYWSANLAAGQTRADVVTLFSESPEFALLTAPWTADGIVFA